MCGPWDNRIYEGKTGRAAKVRDMGHWPGSRSKIQKICCTNTSRWNTQTKRLSRKTNEAIRIENLMNF
jgi:hypothetical protein